MKSNRKIIFKSLILIAVIVICAFLVTIAWFSNKDEAQADGVSIVAGKGYGLEVAFVDEDEAYSAEPINDDINISFPLISGEGVNFYKPKLNLTTGDPLTASDGKWLLKDPPTAAYKDDDGSYAGGDYYEQDIWFRSDKPLDIYLKNTSKVTSSDIEKGNLTNKSKYGDFTKDYIAAAARVALLNVNADNTEALKYIWIPNDNYELIGSSEFTKLEKKGSGTVDDSTFSDDPDITFGIKDKDGNLNSAYENVSYYLSEGYQTSQGASTFTTQVREMYKNISSGLIYGAVDISTTNYVDHAFDITTTNSLSNSNTALAGDKYSSMSVLENYTYHDQLYDQIEAYFEGTYSITIDSSSGTSREWKKLVINANPKDTFFEAIDRFQVLIEYNPDDQSVKIVAFVFYNSETKDGSGTGDFEESLDSYALDPGSDILITGSGSDSITYAMYAGDTSISKLSVTFNRYNTITMLDTKAMFRVVTDAEDSTEYYLQSVATGNYLTANTKTLSLSLTATSTTTATPFTVGVGTSGPVLKYGSYYIAYDSSGGFVLSPKEYGNIGIYEGKSLRVEKNGNSEMIGVGYKYYNGNAEVSLPNADIRLTYQLPTESVVTLTKTNADDKYYKAHIKVRIWAEGTDREAKYPLAGGKFNATLAFSGKEITTEDDG